MLKCLPIIIFIAITFFNINIQAEEDNEIAIPSKIESVTVFLQGAQINRTANASIPKGKITLIFENLSNQIIPTSMQLSNDKQLMLLDVEYNIYTAKSEQWPPQEIRTEYVAYLDQKESIEDQITILNEENKILTTEKTHILSNKMLTESNDEMINIERAYDYFHQKFINITKRILAIDDELESLNSQTLKLKNDWQKRADPFRKKSRSGNYGKFIVQVESTKATTVNFELSYIVQNAQWSPKYDIRTTDINSPLEIDYKSDIMQNTGIDWEDVKLTVSTSNPTVSNNRPILNPWYININEPIYYENQAYDDGANLNMAGSRIGNLRNLAQTNEKVQVYDYEDDEVQEVEIQAAPNASTTKESNTSISFELDFKHSIPSDGDAHTIPLKEESIEAKYLYHIVPKKSTDAFLLAKVKDWGNLNLLGGNASLYFEGTYVGQSYIDPKTISDELILSLGVDKKVNVKRTKLKTDGSKQFIGGKRTKNVSYEISIRNNKSTAIELEVLDQIPLSSDEDIEIELTKSSNAEYTESYGKLLWEMNLKPNETENLEYGFSIKYPKGKTLYGF